jgi:hypothetical protein
MMIAVLSVGAAGDSAHEYLLKYYLLTGRKDKKMLEMCELFLLFTEYPDSPSNNTL